MFNRAKGVIVNGSSFVVNASSPSKGGLDKLIAEVAPNAILNAGGRADEVRCFPGTREEVIEKLEQFINDNSPGKKRMMWLSGPAGAGKSAIFQTVAENCSERGQQAINFFFFRGDNSRSHSKPLVATLVYQLRRLYPALDEPLSDCLETDPLICSATIAAQFKQLISSPIQTIQQSTPIQKRIVIIVDGLDECNNKRDQDHILVALHKLAHADHSPFLVLVASRAEPHLVMSFNRLGSSVKSIFLNDEYKPQKDIRHFVVAKFAEIKKDHHLAQTLNKDWPAVAEIDAIVNKSSGQFIYAATVMRFIQFSSASPAHSLVIILEVAPSVNHNPLAPLDAVYSYIFSNVDNIRTVKKILFARNCSQATENDTKLGSVYRFPAMLRILGYKDLDVLSIFADLVTIIEIDRRSSSRELLKFYHASLDDYLNNESRSTIYYVNEEEFAVELSTLCLRNVQDADSIWLAVAPLRWVRKPTPELSKTLLDASTRRFGHKTQIPFLGELIDQIGRLYWKPDKTQFKALLQSWVRFAYRNNSDKLFYNGVLSQNPSAYRYFKQYWILEGGKDALGLNK